MVALLDLNYLTLALEIDELKHAGKIHCICFRLDLSDGVENWMATILSLCSEAQSFKAQPKRVPKLEDRFISGPTK